jgi:hypothetical protein
MPTRKVARPNATDPAAASPVAIRPSAASTAMATLASPATTSAAVSGAYRPTTVAPTSSRRPVSSSVRVCRTTVSRLISATRMNSVTPIFHTVSAPIDLANSGPLNATSDGLVSTPLTASRSAWVGYSLK